MLTQFLILGFAVVMFFEAARLNNLNWLFRIPIAFGLAVTGFIIVILTSGIIGIAITPLMPTETMDPFGAGEITVLSDSGFFMLTAISLTTNIAALFGFYLLSKRILRRFRKDEIASPIEPLQD